MAAVFARNFAVEPWRGYGAGPPEIFRLLGEGVPWDEASTKLFGGRGSSGNGAAMRVVPVALFACPRLPVAAWLARQTALITHAHPLGMEGAVLQACAITLLLQHPPDEPLDIPRFLGMVRAPLHGSHYLDKLDLVADLLYTGDPDGGRKLGNGVFAEEAVPAALYAFLRQSSIPCLDHVTCADSSAGREASRLESGERPEASFVRSAEVPAGCPRSTIAPRGRLARDLPWRHNDHLTVAYYFARLGDATLALLDVLELPPEGDGRRGTGQPASAGRARRASAACARARVTPSGCGRRAARSRGPWQLTFTGSPAPTRTCLAACGLTTGYMREQRRGFSTFEFQFGATSALRPGALVVVRSAVMHVGTSSLRLFHIMSDARTGAELATLHQGGVHFDQDARRPVPLPAKLASRARAFLVPAEE